MSRFGTSIVACGFMVWTLGCDGVGGGGNEPASSVIEPRSGSDVPDLATVPEPMVQPKLVVDMHAYDLTEPTRGDMVIFNSPYGNTNVSAVRVVGVPGDMVELVNGRVHINREPVTLPSANGERLYVEAPTFAGPHRTVYPFLIPVNEYYLVGTNRQVNADSRFWGPISKNQIVGRLSGR